MAEWELLAQALLDHAAKHEVTRTVTTQHGVKYIIEGELATPDARNPQIRCVWLIEHGESSARLITAYPAKGWDR